MAPSLTELVFGKKGQPLLWSVVGYLLFALVLSAAATVAMGRQELVVYTLAPAVVTIVTAATHRDRFRQTRALAFGAIAALLGGVALSASGNPAIAGAVAGLAFASTTSMKAAPEWTVESDLLSLAYFVGLVVSATTTVPPGAALGAVMIGAIGAAAGLAGELVRLTVRRRDGRAVPAEGYLASRSLAERLRLMTDLGSPIVRFAVVRGMTLGVGAMILANSGPFSRHVMWVLIAVFSVMRPVADDTARWAVMRTAATLAGVLIVGMAGSFAPAQAVLLVGIAGLLVGLLFALRSPVPIAVGSAMIAVTIAGLPDQRFASWAVYRLIETAVGGAIAVAVMFLLMPALNRVFPSDEKGHRAPQPPETTRRSLP